jgi:hypothetical protein
VTASRDDELLFLTFTPQYFEYPRFPFEDGVLPVHLAADLTRVGEFVVDWTPTALAVTWNGAFAFVGHNDQLLNATQRSRHDSRIPDLHIFDVSTRAQVLQLLLPDFVHARGITLASDDRVYVLLGRSRSSVVGVILP